MTAILAQLALAEAAMQNQALSALLFLYRYVLNHRIDDLGEIIRACKPQWLPVVMTREEAVAVLRRLAGQNWLISSLMYGTGLRLLECLRLRVQDVDFDQHEIIVGTVKVRRIVWRCSPKRSRRRSKRIFVG